MASFKSVMNFCGREEGKIVILYPARNIIRGGQINT